MEKEGELGIRPFPGAKNSQHRGREREDLLYVRKLRNGFYISYICYFVHGDIVGKVNKEKKKLELLSCL